MSNPLCRSKPPRRSKPRAQVVLSCFVLGSFLLLISACGGGSSGGTTTDDQGGTPTTSFTLDGNPQDGFFEITGVSVDAAGHFVIEFKLSDNGTPLSITDLDRDPRWHIGWLEESMLPNGDPRSKYQSYIVNTVNGAPYDLDGDGNATDQPALATTTQADRDTGGTLEALGDGMFRYTTGMVLPQGWDQDATHTIACYAHRNDQEDIVNPWAHFVPSGGAVMTHDVVPTSQCASCHDKLGAHGGVRNEVILCQMCHTDQTFDPETGNSVEFEHMIHKIHAGNTLANDYRIIGFRQSVHDYHEIQWTQDVRNCTSCHTGGAESGNWASSPGRAACGSCHDDVNFDTGFEHNAGAFPNDNACSSCHTETMGSEFDISVPGAHVTPYGSSANPNLTFAILDVTGMTPGNAPTVTFTVSDDSGPVDPSTLNRLAMLFAGPTPDYREAHSVTVGPTPDGTLVMNVAGAWEFTPASFTIPVGAAGTWSVGMEGRTNQIPVGGLTIVNVRFGGNNPVVHVDLSVGNLTGTPDSRRTIVTDAKCATCHGDNLRIHGDLRHEIQYCVMCHNTWATDESRRPGLDPATNPPESVDFRYMIHKIHRGAGLEKGYDVYGFGSSLHAFGGVHFPQSVGNCTVCHEGDSWRLPISNDAGAQVFNIGGQILGVDLMPTSLLGGIRPPVTATCLSCHDSDAAAAHALLNSIPNPITDPFNWTESCMVCHGQGAQYDAENYHNK